MICGALGTAVQCRMQPHGADGSQSKGTILRLSLAEAVLTIVVTIATGSDPSSIRQRGSKQLSGL